MEPELPSLPDHVTTRNGVYQYVRRVPLDIADLVGRTHIQVSLKTRDIRIAKTAAAKLHLHWEAVFERYRSQKGLVEPTISTADWEAADWQLLAEWIQADILEQDWQKRLMSLTGEQASRGKEVGRIGEAEENALVEVLIKIRDMVPATYADYRWIFLQERVASLGIRLERMSPHLPVFMAACLRLEVIAMQAIFKRQQQEPMRDVAPHPDEIADKLRARGRLPAPAEAKRAALAPVRAAASDENSRGNEQGPDQVYTLMQCVEKWKEQRVVDNKRLTPENQYDKVKAAQQFARVMEIDHVGAITKRHLRRYHDHLASQDKATSTVNRDVSHITALVKAAERAGWINTIDKAGVYIPVPEGTSERDSFDRDDLEQMFSHVIFLEGMT
jgi:hypothetical protein